MSTEENKALVQSWFDLFNSHHLDPAWLDKTGALLAEEFEFHHVPHGRTHRGLDGYKELTQFFTESSPGMQLEITHMLATGDYVVAEFTARGSNTGPLHFPTGDVPATGRDLEVRCCGVYRIKSGKIVRGHLYYDWMTFLQQLGLVPAMAKAGE